MAIVKLKDLFADKTFTQFRSNSLSMSSVGDECEANAHYNFRWASPIKLQARTQRIFARGLREEQNIIDDLRSIGFEIRVGDGIKQEKIYGFAKHVAGKIDGRIIYEGEEILLEIKTMNDKNFNALEKKGIIIGYPSYYLQVQRYMAATNLYKCMFVALNKNTDNIAFYIIDREDSVIEELIDKEQQIVTREKPFPPKWHADFYKCKNCNNYLVCQFKKAPEVNCRTCKNVDLCDEGEWKCSLTNKTLSIGEQKLGCDKYERLF